jgi:hypothetical protein
MSGFHFRFVVPRHWRRFLQMLRERHAFSLDRFAPRRPTTSAKKIENERNRNYAIRIVIVGGIYEWVIRTLTGTAT